MIRCRRREIDGEHRGGDRAGPAAVVRRRGSGRPDRRPAPGSRRAPRRDGRGGLRGDPDAARPGRAGLLPPRARRLRRGRGRLPGDVPRPVPPGRIDPGRGIAGALAAARGPPGGLEGAAGRDPPSRPGSAALRGRRPWPPKRTRPTSASSCAPRSIACRGSTGTRCVSATSRVGPTTTRRRPSAGRSGRSADGCRGRGRCSAPDWRGGGSASPRWR